MNRRSFLKLSALAPAAATVTLGSASRDAFADEILTFAGGEEAYWDSIRKQFPITKNLLFFNNGTMGPSPLAVTEAVTKQIVHVDSTADYGYDHEKLNQSIGRVLGGVPGDDIATTHNVSEGISIIASGLRMQPGDEVLLTNQEHGGGAVPWLARAKRHGIVVKFVELDPNDDVTFERFEKAMTGRTKIISVPHLTCTMGYLLPVKRLAELAHSKGAYLFVDGAHPPGMLQVNVKELGCDAYASCGHKWLLGPKGTGFLYITKEFREQVMPSWSGAEADKHWDYLASDGNLEFLPTASRYRFATQSSSLYVGLQAAIEWQEKIGFAKIESRILELTKQLREGLAPLAAGKFDMLTPSHMMSGVTTIKLKNSKRYIDFAHELENKYKLRTRIVPENDLEANRFSVHVYTSEKDVEKFIHGVGDCLSSV
ncbi:MAG: aminotransferase class V-fold PLP-dependent enzyme [Bacteroidota bacterium]|nr:aminotransferase class V-fold PLP-dependent enzyme [Bacteroidota bacterium]